MFIHCTVYVLIVLYVQRVDFHKWTQLMPDENLRVIYFYLKQVKVDKNNQYFILFKNVPQKEPISPCKFRYSHFLKVHFVTEENLHLQSQHNVVVVIYNPKHLCHKTIKNLFQKIVVQIFIWHYLHLLHFSQNGPPYCSLFQPRSLCIIIQQTD